VACSLHAKSKGFCDDPQYRCQTVKTIGRRAATRPPLLDGLTGSGPHPGGDAESPPLPFRVRRRRGRRQGRNSRLYVLSALLLSPGPYDVNPLGVLPQAGM
jgi:hypothetical protein